VNVSGSGAIAGIENISNNFGIAIIMVIVALFLLFLVWIINMLWFGGK